MTMPGDRLWMPTLPTPPIFSSACTASTSTLLERACLYVVLGSAHSSLKLGIPNGAVRCSRMFGGRALAAQGHCKTGTNGALTRPAFVPATVRGAATGGQELLCTCRDFASCARPRLVAPYLHRGRATHQGRYASRAAPARHFACRRTLGGHFALLIPLNPPLIYMYTP